MIVRTLIVLFLMASSFGAGYIVSYNSKISTSGASNNNQNNAPPLASLQNDCAEEILALNDQLNAARRGKPSLSALRQGDASDVPQNQKNESTPAPQRNVISTINSISELKTYLDSVSEQDFDLGLVINFVNSTPEGFDFMVAQYQSVTDEIKKQFIREIVSETESPEKIDFALELLNSKDPLARSDAYNWLEQTQALSQPEIYRALIEASYFEEDPDALSGLISTISSPDYDDDDARDSAIARLKELAFHDDTEISSQAISSVSTLTQDENTLNMLKSHLYGNSEERKLAALNGLYYFHNADESLIASIEKIAEDSSSSNDVKDVARDLVDTLREVTSLKQEERNE